MKKQADPGRDRPRITRRSYTFSRFVRDLGRGLKCVPDFLGAVTIPGRMEAGFREKIMLSISRLNQCRRCSAVHGKLAELAGLNDEERAALLELEPGALDHREWVAVEYARRLAACEDGDEIDPELTTELHSLYSAEEITDIEAVAIMINIMNRTGNTWDALLGRLRGEPAEGSSLIDELLVLGLTGPFGIPAFLASELLQRGGGYADPRAGIGDRDRE